MMLWCSSIIKSIWLLSLFSIFKVATADSQVCPRQANPRYLLMNTLADLKIKYVDFNPHSEDYQGNALKFRQEYMSIIPPNTFVINSSPYLMEIILRNKAIREIQEMAFVSLTCLRYLDLSHNEIIYIAKNQFVGLVNLFSLNLSRNNILVLYHFSFKQLPNLEILDLSYNNIAAIDEFAFNMLWKLKSLFLNKNKMTRFTSHFFRHLSNLKHLDISSNFFSLIDTHQFSDLESLETLDLTSNGLTVFTFFNLKAEFHQVQIINLSSNSIIQNFNIKHLRKYFPNEKLLIDINNNYFYCHELEGILKDLRRYKIKYAPGRAPGTAHHREHILCDALNNTNEDDHYTFLQLANMLGSTTKKPKTSDYEYVLKTYRQDSLRHRRTLMALVIIISVTVLYNMAILIDYLLDYKILKTLCVRRQYVLPTEQEQIPLQS